MELHVSKNYDALSEQVADWIVELIVKTLSNKEKFSVALTGGNTPKKLYEILAGDEYKNKIDWSRANVFVGDERFVPSDDDKSNAKMIRETLTDHVAINESNVHFMQTENMSPETSANVYQEVLNHYFTHQSTVNGQQSTFDLVLLGMGDDAHTLSLFPGQTAAINEQTKWVTSLWNDEQKMHRITLTAPVVNAAKCVAFLISGKSKVNALNNVLHQPLDPEKFPSQIIKPASGELHFFVDEAAMGN